MRFIICCEGLGAEGLGALGAEGCARRTAARGRTAG
jgi:hypothetical protein